VTKPSHDTRWPRRLQDEHRDVGQIIRKYARRLEAGDNDEPAAFARTRQAARRSNVRPLLATAGMLAAAGVAAALLFARTPSELARPLATAPTVPTAAPTLSLGSTPVALPTGATELSVGASVVLKDGAIATARSEGGNATILLEMGRIDLQVQPRAPGRSFTVQAGPFSFVVVGTAFSVSRQGERVTLDVREGRVAVVREGQQLASITAGGSWTGQTQTEDVTQPAAPPPRRPRAAASKQASRGHGPGSDIAAYEAARLWMDAAGDLERARIGFESYRTRFPHGALRVEAALSLVEILPRLGRHRDALAETDRLLADPEAQPRYAEIHLVRGNIFRLALGDRNAAAAEYHAAAAGSGATADEAAYLHTVCLEEMGRRLEARNALDLYLARPDARHTNEALRRRSTLSR